LICPVCREAMIVVEHQRIELDYCVQCHGIWFDSGELELMLKSFALPTAEFSMASITALPEKKVAEKRRKCPLCRKNMKKVTVGHAPEVLIDACPKGQGLWFDGGEIGQVIKQLLDTTPGSGGAPSHAHGRVISFLGETFKARG